MFYIENYIKIFPTLRKYLFSSFRNLNPQNSPNQTRFLTSPLQMIVYPFFSVMKAFTINLFLTLKSWDDTLKTHCYQYGQLTYTEKFTITDPESMKFIPVCFKIFESDLMSFKKLVNTSFCVLFCHNLVQYGHFHIKILKIW